jgi:hypothetical protein
VEVEAHPGHGGTSDEEAPMTPDDDRWGVERRDDLDEVVDDAVDGLAYTAAAAADAGLTTVGKPSLFGNRQMSATPAAP